MNTPRSALLFACAMALGATGQSVPDTMARDQILEIANENLLLHWYCDTYNLYTGVTNATCPYTVTGWKDGIPYKWGGYDSRDAFWQAVVVNHGRAGDTNSAAVVSGTYGDDCSGYASLCLRSGRYATSTLPNICTQTDYSHIAPGDLMNYASSHVRIFEKYTGTNLTQEFEATTGVSPGRVTHRVLATDSKYVPQRYDYCVTWPSIVRVVGTSASSALVEFLGAASTGFRVYRSTDLSSWSRIADETTLGPLAQSATASGLQNATTYYFKVCAVNGTAESAASCIFALRLASGAQKALLVNGYDRWTRKTESAGLPHTFVPRDAQALAAAGYAFDTVDNLRIIDQTTALSSYSSVWWMLGDESTTDETFSQQEQLRVQAYLEGGGHLFVSGAEIAWDLVSKANVINDASFATNYLKIGYASDGSAGNGYGFTGAAGTAFASASGSFDSGSGGTFNVLYPDILTAQPGAQAVLRYSTGTTAAVSYQGRFGSASATGAVVVCGFPLESVTSAAARQALVNAATTTFFGTSAVGEWSLY